MITLITGVPGSGKTLYALNMVKARAEKENRQVYQSGITDLTLPWEVLEDATQWHTLPKGSIVVIDECQRVFRPRGAGKEVPQHVVELETHRHKGLDVVLITQHPNLVDSNVRRLVGQHFHAIRRFGGARAVLHEWGSCTEPSKASILAAVRHDFSYPKESFQWYKSAEVHTHKRRIPMRMFFMWGSPLFIALLVFLAVRAMRHPADLAHQVGPGAAQVVGTIGAGGVVHRSLKDARGDFLEAHEPRIAGLAHTAMAYDALTAPTRVPVPAACVRSLSKCRCFSQDATVLNVGAEMCSGIVDGGYFLEFDPSPKKDAAGPQSASGGPVGGAGVAGTPTEPMTLATAKGSLQTSVGPARGR